MTILQSLFLLLCWTCSALAADGFTTSPALAKDGTPIGSSVLLTEDSKVVYIRMYGLKANPQRTKDKPYHESILIDDATIVELQHVHGDIRALIQGGDKYLISIDFSADHSAIRQIIATAKGEMKEFVWKADADGFLTDYAARSLNSPKF